MDDKTQRDSPLFRRMFLDRLPANVQMLLKASLITDLDEMAQKADEMTSLTQHSIVAKVTTGNDDHDSDL
ncbi:hypothetical protein TTRE_0000977201 [Trichuris trichiura]|uniref:Uncharacterized protein n=1 Tax=Trichuris trichiura TaxID=36087 RepID=A0A077ZLW5_TRITR|nr:hypothetical protein TTRE_0000977201 [Trichuris trichiura]